jgi:hypothetical protein
MALLSAHQNYTEMRNQHNNFACFLCSIMNICNFFIVKEIENNFRNSTLYQKGLKTAENVVPQQ